MIVQTTQFLQHYDSADNSIYAALCFFRQLSICSLKILLTGQFLQPFDSADNSISAAFWFRRQFSLYSLMILQTTQFLQFFESVDNLVFEALWFCIWYCFRDLNHSKNKNWTKICVQSIFCIRFYFMCEIFCRKLFQTDGLVLHNALRKM